MSCHLVYDLYLELLAARRRYLIHILVYFPTPRQVLNIPTKINKGTVEIVAPVELVKAGEKVGSSEAALLSKLNIRPFSYGLIIEKVRGNGSPPLLAERRREIAAIALWFSIDVGFKV